MAAILLGQNLGEIIFETTDDLVVGNDNLLIASNSSKMGLDGRSLVLNNLHEDLLRCERLCRLWMKLRNPNFKIGFLSFKQRFVGFNLV